MVFFKHATRVYIYQAEDLMQFQTVQSKKGAKAEAAKAKECRELMLEARAPLKESTRVDTEGDVEAAQRLRAKAANRQEGAVSHHAPTPFPHPEPSRPTP